MDIDETPLVFPEAANVVVGGGIAEQEPGLFGSARAQRIGQQLIAINEVNEDSGVADSDRVVDETKRAKQTRAIERSLARNIDFGVSATEFDSLPGNAMRLHYSAETYMLDPVGDNELIELHRTLGDTAPESAFDMTHYEALCSRPYYLCKIDVERQAAVVTSADTLALAYKRPAQFSARQTKDRAVPFDDVGAAAHDDSTVVLFTEHSALPRMHGHVIEFTQAADYDAASGVLLFRLQRNE